MILLRDLCDQTGAKIVVISSYIRLKICSLIEKSLIDFGLPIFGTVSKYESRGYAIKEFLRNHPCDKFVILDDEVFGDYDEELLHFLIKTDYYNGGLQYHHIREVLDYFKDVHVEKFLLMQQSKLFN